MWGLVLLMCAGTLLTHTGDALSIGKIMSPEYNPVPQAVDMKTSLYPTLQNPLYTSLYPTQQNPVNNRVVNYQDFKEACRYSRCNYTIEDHPEHCYKQPDCSHTIIQGEEYRTLDGSCNNKFLHILGMSGTPYRRLLPVDYSHNMKPRSTKYGTELPSARDVAKSLLPVLPTSPSKHTFFAAQFWKFVYADLISTPKAETDKCCNKRESFYGENKYGTGECFPIITQDKYGKRCDEFTRNHRYPSLDCKEQNSEQIDLSSMWLDLSNIYGSNQDSSHVTRDPHDPRFLKVSKSVNEEYLLPSCQDKFDTRGCFYSGDKKQNDDPMLAIQHLMFIKEHNRLAWDLSKINPHWSKETIFQETRKIMIAVYQNIVYSEFLPFLLGDKYCKAKLLKPVAKGYNQEYESNLDARISSEFATAALRLLNLEKESFPLVNPFGYMVGHLDANQYQQNPQLLAKKDLVNQAIRGSLKADNNQKEYLDKKDILVASYNIQRGRDRGLTGYNRYLELIHKKGVLDFHGLLNLGHLNPEQIKMLTRLYKTMDDIDLWVGGILEMPLAQGVVGPTFRSIITEQFKRLKYGDRLWFEYEDAGFSLRQLEEIRKSSTAALMCNNFDINQIQPNIFVEAGTDNTLTPCSAIPKLDLRMFADYAAARISVDAKEESSPEWSYSGLTGPAYWSKTFPECGVASQSPIDVKFNKINKSKGPALEFYNYQNPYDATLVKTKKNVDLELADIPGIPKPEVSGGYISKGTKYRFHALHFHWGSNSSVGSEHRLNEKDFPSEVHFVHYNTKYGSVADAASQPDGLLVLGFFLQLNKRTSPGLRNIVYGLNKLERKDSVHIGQLSLFKILGFVPTPGRYIFYQGSLTTPPCSENVLWHLFPEPISVTEQDLIVFRSLVNSEGKSFSDNYRPVQPINGRKIIMNGEDISSDQPMEDEVSGDWSYKGDKGPEYWSKTYPICGGLSQSPIDIPLKQVDKGANLKLIPYLYNQPIQATLVKGNKNVDFEFEESGAQPLLSGGYIPNNNRYQFASLHFHWGSHNSVGSEHLVNGASYPAEAHFVHFNKKYGTLAEAADKPDGLLVLGFFLKISKISTPGLHIISQGLKHLDSTESVHIGQLSIFDIVGVGSIPAFSQYVFYKGSLTTPPCNEKVLWHVFPHALSISQEDLNSFRNLKKPNGKSYSDNYRPVQSINGRKVLWRGVNLNDVPDYRALTVPMEEDSSPKWSYSGPTGPSYWYLQYPACGGKSQSPVDLPALVSSYSYASPLTFMFYDKLFPAVLEKGDHNLDLKFNGVTHLPRIAGGYFRDQYEFAGLHFHWGSNNYRGSEHRLKGFEFPGEAHFVHFNKKYGSLADAADKPDGLLVLGFFLKLSRAGSIGMRLLADGLRAVEHKHGEISLGDLSIQSILGFSPSPSQYTFYQGSLTTPPCTENVLWHVFPEPIRVTEFDLAAFRQLTSDDGKSFSDNNRPAQPLNNRQVLVNGVPVVEKTLTTQVLKPSVESDEPATWSYSGSTGPEYWSRVYPECGGKSQSPIDINTFKTFKQSSTPLKLDNYNKLYPSLMEKTKKNVDLSFQGLNKMPWISGGYIPQGERYMFGALHFHWGSNNKVGSEHRLNGFEFPGEAHFVHFNSKYGNLSTAASQPDGLLVLGFFLQVAPKTGPGLSQVADGLRELATGKETVSAGQISVDSILGYIPLHEYFFYQGSLTTPPCSENVLWHMFPSAIKISEKDLGAFRALKNEDGKSFSDNNRPVQELNGRKVLKKRVKYY